MAFNLTHSQIILRYKENGRWSEPYYSNHGRCTVVKSATIVKRSWNQEKYTLPWPWLIYHIIWYNIISFFLNDIYMILHHFLAMILIWYNIKKKWYWRPLENSRSHDKGQCEGAQQQLTASRSWPLLVLSSKQFTAHHKCLIGSSLLMSAQSAHFPQIY
jgi:hypothetical protein